MMKKHLLTIRLLMVLILIILFFISSVFLFISCKSLREITFADKNSTLRLEKGVLLRLKLESNPTTGYQWVLSEYTDTGIIFQKDYIFSEKDENEELVGVGGIEIFVFEAINSGKTELILSYIRPWEKEEPKEEFIFKINIIVK